MRPYDSYSEEGAEAYYEEKGDQCPYPEGTFREVEWRLGYLQAQENDPLAALANGWIDEEGFRDDLSHRRYALKGQRTRLLFKANSLAPTIEATEAIPTLGPTAKWPGNCHAVATQIHRAGLLKPLEEVFGEAKVVFGCYTGDVAPGNMFSGKPVVRHGWVEFESGLVMDPTRWVFENRPPYLAFSSINEYDLGARRTRNQILGRRPPPAFDESRPRYRWDVNDPEVTALVHGLLKDNSRLMSDGELGQAQVVWIANLPLAVLGDHARAVYAAFDRIGMRAAIPLDNRLFAMGDDEPEEELSWEMRP